MSRILVRTVVLILSAAALFASDGNRLPETKPENVGMSAERLALLDIRIGEALSRGDFPGAVLLVTRKGHVVWRKSYGLSSMTPEKTPMPVDMIFDLASLTKPVVTATAVMRLVEDGRIRLWDKVRDYLPEFEPFMKEGGSPGQDARLWHLLTHTSGLPAYTDPADAAAACGDPAPTASLARHIGGLRKEAPIGESFVYSCLNYIVLAHIVESVSGQPLDVFAEERIFKPLKMTTAGFKPRAELMKRIVPTQVVAGAPLRGIVHDPLARLQGGVSGNAGLFATADDLAVFAQMMLNGGEFDGVRILSPLSVERMTEIHPRVPGFGRGFGWDLDSGYATVKGDLFGARSYGHSGYTGTSLWIDPETETAVVFLTNRVHPDDKGEIIALRSKVANIVAAAVLEK
ncbi:MAG: serine hydrolase [Acidobacteriota bacterium]|nr:serine hydrolase [Acidobacteriota bacterium]